MNYDRKCQDGKYLTDEDYYSFYFGSKLANRIILGNEETNTRPKIILQKHSENMDNDWLKKLYEGTTGVNSSRIVPEESKNLKHH